MALRYTLGSDSRLKREQHIETLFRSGKAFSVFPLRVVWLLLPKGKELTSMRAGFSVPKKKFKRAVDRARIKRLMRESWRLQQHDLLPAIPEGQQLHLFLIFMDVALPAYANVYAATGKAMMKLTKILADA